MLRAVATAGAQVREAALRIDEADLSRWSPTAGPARCWWPAWAGRASLVTCSPRSPGWRVPFPLIAHRGYRLPGWVGPMDLVVSVSCSGRTEETLAVTDEALRRGRDLLTGLGLDASEVRANDRKLLFEDVGIVTMRTSDVPTYVEAGAADIGITGKDVLLEQSERAVYELLDLGLRPLHDGPCDRRWSRSRGGGTASPRRDARRHQIPAPPRTRTSRPRAAKSRSSR